MDASAVVTLLGAAISGYKAAVDTLDEAKIAVATKELTGEVMKIGAEVLALQQDALQATDRERALLREKNDLEDRVRALEKRLADRDRYELIEGYTGVFTLRLKESSRNGEPMHHLCAHCMENKSVKAILQFVGGKKELAHCPECRRSYRFETASPKKPAPLVRPVGMIRR